MADAPTRVLTQLLRAWKDQPGDPEAENAVFATGVPLLQRRAKAILGANRGFSHKIDAADLVNEAWLRIRRDFTFNTDDRQHFLKTFSRAMRNFLMDQADHDHAVKRPLSRLSIGPPSDEHVSGDASTAEMVELMDLIEALEATRPRQAQILKLKGLSGCELSEIAKTLNISLAQVKRDYTSAKAWLFVRLGGQ